MKTDYYDAAQTIAEFEGFEPHARWDVNAYRLGYGSDTLVTRRHVLSTDTVNETQALADLVCRIPEFEAVIVAQVSQASWDALPAKAKSALLSFAYNYGHLEPTIASEVKTRASLAAISLAVAARATDNGGENAHRRHAEATLIAEA